MVDISTRPTLTAGIALTTASAIAFTPLLIADTTPRAIAPPHLSTPSIDLRAAITPDDLAALAANLDDMSESVSATVTSLAGLPGNTLVDALNSAAAANDALWDSLIAATDNQTLIDILEALRATSNGGLTRLATTVESANDTIILTSGEIANLVASTVTGALGTAQHAVATLINSPLSVPSYTALVNVPLDLAGLALNSGLGAAQDIGVNAFDLGNTLLTGVTAQITNALGIVDGLLDTTKGLSDVAVIDGVLTAIQGIVSAPVTVSVAAANGLTHTLTAAGKTAWTRLTNGAAAAVSTWVGNGTTPGALQGAINTIGATPLSPAAYTTALSDLVGAGVTTLNTAIGTARSMASIPVSAAADLATTAADMITSVNKSLATTAAGIMQAAGLPSLVYNLPHVMAAGINGAVHIAGLTTAATLDGIAAAIDFGNTLTGALPTQRILTLSVATDSPALAASAESTQPLSAAGTAADTTETDRDSGTADTSSADVLADPSAPHDAAARALTDDIGPAPADDTPTADETAETDVTTPRSQPDRLDSATPDTTPGDPHDVTPSGAAEDGQDAHPDEHEHPTDDEAATRTDDSPDTSRSGATTNRSSTRTTDSGAAADGAPKPRNGATSGGKHAFGNTNKPASVSDITNRLDKESTPGKPRGSADRSSDSGDGGDSDGAEAA